MLPPPGGDVIGRRRVDTHLQSFQALGAEMIEELQAKKLQIDEQIEELRLINKVCRQKIANRKRNF